MAVVHHHREHSVDGDERVGGDRAVHARLDRYGPREKGVDERRGDHGVDDGGKDGSEQEQPAEVEQVAEAQLLRERQRGDKDGPVVLVRDLRLCKLGWVWVGRESCEGFV